LEEREWIGDRGRDDSLESEECCEHVCPFRVKQIAPPSFATDIRSVCRVVGIKAANPASDLRLFAGQL
jgi:hypothetical protein